MKAQVVLSGYTDHSYYGRPTETTTVIVYADTSVIEDMGISREDLIKLAKEELHSHCRSMPHRYWQGERKGVC